MKKSTIGLIVLALVVVGVVVAVIAGQSDNKSTSTTTTTTNHQSDDTNVTTDSAEKAVAQSTVDISGFSFSPKAITVKKGTKVTWTNKDSSAHTVTPDKSGDFTGSDTLEQGESFSATFNTVGTITYHCSFHSSMTGTVQVTE